MDMAIPESQSHNVKKTRNTGHLSMIIIIIIIIKIIIIIIITGLPLHAVFLPESVRKVTQTELEHPEPDDAPPDLQT